MGRDPVSIRGLNVMGDMVLFDYLCGKFRKASGHTFRKVVTLLELFKPKPIFTCFWNFPTPMNPDDELSSQQRSGPNDDSPNRAHNAEASFESIPTLYRTTDTDPQYQRIGNYKLLQLIGEGGMGAVWMAEQTEPVERRVAIKLIKQGRDSKQIVARFEAERQALALMDHPFIAKILDGGTTESGQPYFVMELMQGLQITKYCDKHRLSIPERLKLFMQVCSAVQHAHQKGIIHRDLKPANILVGIYDGKSLPKVIDFGLAKAVDRQSKLTDKTLFTEFGAILGTLQYMSPEQADLDASDIDTRTDIYALGVLLYELLIGSTPVEEATLKQMAMLKILETIRETDPPTPSTRLSSSSHQLVDISSKRRIEPVRLQAELRGDLDWIVMKALEKDRSRRYESASGFAADIERYLTDRPVDARPPSNAYKLSKFLKKNRGSVVAVTVMFLLLLTGLIGTSLGLLEARRQTGRANDARIEAEDNFDRAVKAETETKERVKELEEITEFQTSQLSNIDVPKMGIRLQSNLLDQFLTESKKLGQSESEATAELADLEKKFNRINFVDASLDLLEENIFKRAERVIESQYKDKPLLAASLLHAIGVSLRELGKLDSAESSLRKECEIRLNIQGSDHGDTINAKNSLAVLLSTQGNLTEAEKLQREVLEVSRRTLGDEHPQTLSSINNMAILFRDQGKLEEAEPLQREAVEARRRIFGNEHPDTLMSINELGALLRAQEKWEEAEKLFRENLESNRRILGNENPNTLVSINNMAVILRDNRRFEESETLYRECLEGRLRILGNEHPETLIAISNMASILRDTRKFKEAESHFRAAVEAFRRVLGNEHPDTLVSMNNMAMFLQAQGKLDEAAPLLREAMEGRRRMLGVDHPRTLTSIHNMAYVLHDQGRLEEAEPLYRKALEARRRTLGGKHPDTLKSINGTALFLQSQGNLDEAELLLREAINNSVDRPESRGLHHNATIRLARIYNSTNRSNASLELLEQFRNAPDAVVFQELTDAQMQLGQIEDCRMLIKEFVERSRMENSKSPKVLIADLQLAARASNRMEDFKNAEPLARKSLELAIKAEIANWELERIRSTLGVSLLGLGRRDDASPLLESSCETIERDASSIPIEIRKETLEEAKAAFAKLQDR